MRDLLFATPIALVMLLVACNMDKGATNNSPTPTNEEKSTSKRVVSVNTSDNNVSAKVKESENVTVSTTSDANITTEASTGKANTLDELVKQAVNTKPTAKVVTRNEKKSVSTEKEAKATQKPVKKPKPNPVRSAPVKYLPKIEFDELAYDFGEITEGDIVKHNFTFTNIGKNKLSIEKATATCGCTKPSFPFIDINPGETGYIGVTYNSVNKNGDQKPEITVYSNAAQSEITLYLTGTVKPKPEEEEKEDEEKVEVKEMPQDTTKN